MVAPFACWAKSFESPPWWIAYNSLKHDRFTHQSNGTLETAINCIAALILAIVYCGCCDWAIVSSDMLDAIEKNPWGHTTSDLLRDIKVDSYAKIETKLFAHPVGLFAFEHANLSNYWPARTPRYSNWWALNAHTFTKE